MNPTDVHGGEPDRGQESRQLPPITFDNLPPEWQEAMARAGWSDLMPVQAQAIPFLLARRDLMVQSRTGSGKTGAFLLPILSEIDPGVDACQALVLAPTRELARQVARDARTLAGEHFVRIVSVYGGVGYGDQLQGMRAGAHLVVGTPGRVLDHLLRRSLTLDKLKVLVFDEADRLLSIGFYRDMLELQRYLPARGQSTYMFSATFPPRVMHLATVFMREPAFLGLSGDNVHVATTEHVFYVTPGMDKDRALVRIIEIENPDSAIIFCNTRQKVHYVRVVLQRFGYDADELSSDLSQSDREQVLARVREGTLRFLVATDVAARGIDIPELSHVVQYEPPEDNELYIHRAGRTGRAGAGGEAITLVDLREKIKLMQIARQYHIDLQERPLPTDEDVAAVVAERMTAILENRLRGRDKLQTERMRRFRPLAESLGSSEDELSLLTMLLDDAYQLTLHAPPEPPPAGPVKKDKRGSGRKRSRRRKPGRNNRAT